MLDSESLVSLITLIILITSVHPLVCCKVTFLREGLVTLISMGSPISGVDHSMSHKGTLLSESRVTLISLIRFVLNIWNSTDDMHIYYNDENHGMF